MAPDRGLHHATSASTPLAIAFGVRTAGGRYVFPPDIEERLGEREAALVRRIERLRGLGREAASLADDASKEGDCHA